MAKIVLVTHGVGLTSIAELPVLSFFIFAAAKFGIMINLVLMLLNLLPIPPLDGSRVVSSVLPNKISLYYNSIERFGIWILLALLVTGVLQWILFPPIKYLMALFAQWFGLPDLQF